MDGARAEERHATALAKREPRAACAKRRVPGCDGSTCGRAHLVAAPRVEVAVGVAGHAVHGGGAARHKHDLDALREQRDSCLSRRGAQRAERPPRALALQRLCAPRTGTGGAARLCCRCEAGRAGRTHEQRLELGGLQQVGVQLLALSLRLRTQLAWAQAHGFTGLAKCAAAVAARHTHPAPLGPS